MNVLLTLFLLFLVIVLLFTNLKYRDNFYGLTDIICDTIEEKKDCKNYACKWKDKPGCKFGDTLIEGKGCPKLSINKIIEELNKIEANNENYILKVNRYMNPMYPDDPQYSQDYRIFIVKPGKAISTYFKDSITDIIRCGQYIKKLDNYWVDYCKQNPNNCFNNFDNIQKSLYYRDYTEEVYDKCIVNPFLDPPTNNDSIINDKGMVKILHGFNNNHIKSTPDKVDGNKDIHKLYIPDYNEFYFMIEEVHWSKLRIFGEDAKYKYIYTYDPSKDIMSSCDKEIDNPEDSNYKKCKNNIPRCVSDYDNGCFHINNKDQCNNNKKCEWEDTKGCYPNYTLEKDKTCLNHKFRSQCITKNECRYYNNIKKCLHTDHDLCEIKTINECNSDNSDTCRWNTQNQKCVVRKNMNNLLNNVNQTINSNNYNLDDYKNSLDATKAAIYGNYYLEMVD